MSSEYEENPTAKILMRFMSKPSVDVQAVKAKQREVRHEVVAQAKALSEAVKKESKKSTQLNEARKARAKKEVQQDG